MPTSVYGLPGSYVSRVAGCLKLARFLVGSLAIAACATDVRDASGDAAVVVDAGPPAADAGSAGPDSELVPAASDPEPVSAPSDADSQTPAADPGSPGDGILCTGNDVLPIDAAGLRPARAYDYLAVRRRFGPGGIFVTQVGDYDIVSETGSPCATATQAQCQQSVVDPAAAFVTTACTNACFEESIVTTHGDEVKRWIGADQAKELLGEIDSPDDALWLVRSAGYEVECGRTSVQATADGYELRADKYETPRCASDCRIQQALLHVSKSGDISTRHSQTIEKTCACGP